MLLDVAMNRAFLQDPLPTDATSFNARVLHRRLQPFIKRTLRCDVLEYVPYTQRHALTTPFSPSAEEGRFYELISAYLQRDFSYGFPSRQSICWGSSCASCWLRPPKPWWPRSPLFSGGNQSPASTGIYQHWLTQYTGSDRITRFFWWLTQYVLAGQDRFDNTKLGFDLQVSPVVQAPTGTYQPIRKGETPPEHARVYLLTHPQCLTFHYGIHKPRISMLERLVGQSGWMQLSLLELDSFQHEERLVFIAFTDTGDG